MDVMTGQNQSPPYDPTLTVHICSVYRVHLQVVLRKFNLYIPYLKQG